MTLNKLNSIIDKAAETHQAMLADDAGELKIAPIALHQVPLRLFLAVARQRFKPVSVLGGETDTYLFLGLPGIHLFSEDVPQVDDVDA